jgi:hypothetical protein
MKYYIYFIYLLILVFYMSFKQRQGMSQATAGGWKDRQFGRQGQHQQGEGEDPCDRGGWVHPGRVGRVDRWETDDSRSTWV